jgi:threonine aldolase
VIDLRSDTVTKPTPAMRAAMAAAEVGDDVYGEDPTVNRLEARAAEIFGREAGTFAAQRHHGQSDRDPPEHAARPGSDLRSTLAHCGMGNRDGLGVFRMPIAHDPGGPGHSHLERHRAAHHRQALSSRARPA